MTARDPYQPVRIAHRIVEIISESRIKAVREYLWIVGVIAAFAVSTFFFEYERYVVILVFAGGAAWLLLTIITDRQEANLYKDLDDLTDEEYEQFLDDAEEQGLVERKRTHKK
jgi:hypothetical protein